MKELLLHEVLSSGIVRGPQNHLPILQCRFYSLLHDQLASGFSRSVYPDRCEETQFIVENFQGKDAKIVELFCGRGEKMKAILEDLEAMKTENVHTFLDTTGLKFVGVDYQLERMTTAWAEKYSEVSFENANLLNAEEFIEDSVDFAFVCLDNPTATNFTAQKIESILKTISRMLKTGGRYMVRLPIFSPFEKITLGGVISLGDVELNGQVLKAYGIRAGRLVSPDYQELHELVVLGDEHEEGPGKYFVPQEAFHFAGEGNHLMSSDTYKYLASKFDMYTEKEDYETRTLIFKKC